MALSDAKSLPIDRSVAVLEDIIKQLKEYRKKVLLYNDVATDRAALVLAILNGSNTIRFGQTALVMRDLGELVETVARELPSAPVARRVQSPRQSVDEAKMLAEHETKLRAYRDGSLVKAYMPMPPQVAKAYADDNQKQSVHAGDHQGKALDHAMIGSSEVWKR